MTLYLSSMPSYRREECRFLCDSSIFTAIIMDWDSYRLNIVSSSMSQARGMAHQEFRRMGTEGTGQGGNLSSRDTEGEVLACLQPNWG